MNKTSHFKLGFLRALAENGISAEQFAQMVEKRAEEEGFSGISLKPSPNLIETGLNLGVFLPAAAALGLGGVAGYGLGKAYHTLTKDPPGPTIDDLKNNEVINEIKLQSGLLARKAQKRQSVNGNVR